MSLLTAYDTYANGYSAAYANSVSNSHSYAYGYSNSDSNTDSYPYSYGPANAHCKAAHITQATSHSRAAANPVLEYHVEKPVESAQLLYETEVHNWV